MQLFRFFLLLCLPALLFQFSPIFSEEIEDSHTFFHESAGQIFIPRDENGLLNPWGYFDPQNIFAYNGYIEHYFAFIDLLEDIDFLESLSEEELDELVDFAVWIVRYSVPENRPDLFYQYEEDIQDLFRHLEEIEAQEEEEELCYLSSQSQYLPIQLAYSLKDPKILLCKKKKKKKKGGLWNQIKRKSKHFGHWCKKHKKPLIAGTVVVATVTTAVLTGGVGGSAAAAVGGGLVNSIDDNPSPKRINKPGDVHFQDERPPPPSLSKKRQDFPLSRDRRESSPLVASLPTPPSEHPYLNEAKEKIEQKSEIAKSEIATNTLDKPLNTSEKTFWEEVKEGAKETSAYIAHEALEAVSELVAILPEAQAAFPYDHPSSDDPRSSFQESIEAAHQKIDMVFDTSQSSLYESEAKRDTLALKEKLSTEVTVGWLPPPGSIGNAAKNTKKTVNPVNRSNNHQCITFMDGGKTKTISIGKMSHSGNAMDRGGLTKAGRALQKKTDRIGSVFEKPLGAPHEVNLQGQKVLDEILNHPDKVITIEKPPTLKFETIDIKLPDGRGARFTKDGKEMIGFLEP